MTREPNRSQYEWPGIPRLQSCEGRQTYAASARLDRGDERGAAGSGSAREDSSAGPGHGASPAHLAGRSPAEWSPAERVADAGREAAGRGPGAGGRRRMTAGGRWP